MKRLFFFLFIFFFGLNLSPSLVFAIEPADCDEGTIDCVCPPDLGASDVVSNPQDPENAKTSCFEYCYNYKDIHPDIKTYKLQCKVGGTLTPVAEEYLTLADQENAESVTDEDIAVPQLGVEIPGFEPSSWSKVGSNLETNVLGEYVQAIYGWLLIAGSLTAIVILMVGGLQYMMARGNEGAIGAAKQRMSNAVMGLVLLFFAYTIAYFIDPNTVKFDTLVIQHIDPVLYVEESGDAAGSIQSASAIDFDCGDVDSVREFAEAMVGRVCYRFGGKGGPAPYPYESKIDSNGKPYKSYCPDGKLCFDCSGFVGYAAKCLGLSSANEESGTAGIFTSADAEKATTCDSTSINNISLRAGDLVGWPSLDGQVGHVFLYIGGGDVTDSHGGTDGRECNAVTIKSFSWVCNKYGDTSHGLYVVRRPEN